MKKRRMNNNVLEVCDENDVVVLAIGETLAADKSMVIKVTGEIRNEVAHDFEDEVMTVLSVCKKIVLDMKDVTYIASMALKSLLSIQQMIDEIEDSSMVLCHVTPEVMNIFKESGFSEILLIETD